MNSLKKKFGKFAVSTKKMAKVNGGWMAVCGDEIVASDSLEVLWQEMQLRGNCSAA